MEEKSASTILLKELYNSRKKIIVIAVLCAIIAIGITWFIPKKYHAEGIVYPTNSNSIKDVVNNSNFGHEYHTDRLIQLFESQQMKEMLIHRFNLIDHYKLDTNSKDWRHTLNKRFARDMSFSRSKYMAVNVGVTSSSPTLSADMVNSMLDYIDIIRKDILFENAYALSEDLETKVKAHKKFVDSLLTRISEESRTSKPNSLAKKLNSKLEENKRSGEVNYGDDIIIEATKNNYTLENAKTINEYFTELAIFSNLKKELVSINEKISMPFPKVYRVSSAVPDYKQSSPSFSINAILGFVLGLFGSITFFVVRNNWRKVIAQFQDE